MLSASVLAFAVAVPAIAVAQEAPNPQADALNDQGKELYKGKDYQGAAAKFREAIAIAPDARYYFNLCATLEKAGDLDGALEACDAVYQYAPEEDLKGKTGQRAASIRQAKRERDAANPGTSPGPDPGPNPGPNPGPGPGTGGQIPPSGGDISKPVAPGDYNWAFGAEVGPIVAGTYDIEGTNFIEEADSGVMFRLYGDKTFGSKLGGRVFLGLGGLSYPNGTMSIVELGVAGFTNIKLAKNLYITPTVGAMVAGFSISVDDAFGSSDSFSTFGINLGAPISLVLGGKHVLYVNPVNINYYMPSTSDMGLDSEGGSTIMITFGYQMRLQKGELPPGFVVLE